MLKLARRELLKIIGALGLSMTIGPFRADATDEALSPGGDRLSSTGDNRTQGLIVLGMDGLDPGICKEMMAAGELPAFSKMAETGIFSEMATSAPPQSPVAWSSMATSMNPGQHGLYDFLTCNKDTYLIELGVLKRNQRNLLGLGSSMFLPVREGVGFWEIIARSNLPSTTLRWPVTFPPQAEKSRLLSGLGVPDILGGLGRYSFYSDSKDLLGEGAKGNVKLLSFKNGKAVSEVIGPKVAKLTGESNATAPLEIEIIQDKNSVRLTLDGDSDTIEIGSNSKWFRPKFSVGLLSSARGICKFYLGGINPLRLHMTPVEVDPKSPVFPISAPEDFSGKLAEEWGLFHTLGMPEDTNAVIEDHLDEEGFLKQCDEIISSQEKIFFGELESFEKGLLANVFFSSDRIQHIFWVTRDPKHPAYSEEYTEKYDHVIPELYKRMDGIVGKTLEIAKKKGCEVIVCSDHGFTSFRHGLHVNSWLAKEGFMALKVPPSDSDESGDPLFQNVDWSGTKAYFFGFNQIFLNLKGREAKGIVTKEQAGDLLAKIKEGLLGLRDGNGTPVVSEVFLGKDIYSGSKIDMAPDLVIGFHPGFRASWQSALGAAPGGDILAPNLKKWTGDHLIDPAAVPGSLFCTLPLKPDSPTILDIAPTALSILGVSAPEHFEGKSLL